MFDILTLLQCLLPEIKVTKVIREGLRLLKRFNDHSEEYKLWLNEKIAIGLDQLDNGQSLTALGARDRIRNKAQKFMKPPV